MPLPYHLIDGYNVLHAAGLARASYGPGDLGRARTGLLVLLADGLDDAERERTTVVFDAAEPPRGAERSFRFREMAVLFAIDEGEADALIEDLIRRHPSPRQLRVVSDDVRLQKAARRRGAQSVKAEALLRRLGRRGAATPLRQDGPASSAAEAAPVSEWLEFFGMEGGKVEVDDPASALQDAANSQAALRRRDADPATAGQVAPRPQASRPAPPDRPVPSPESGPEDEASGEDFGFWQQRIDELLRRENQRPGAG